MCIEIIFRIFWQLWRKKLISLVSELLFDRYNFGWILPFDILVAAFSPQISNAISKCCTLVVRESVHSGEVGVQAIDPILSVYEKLLDAFLKGWVFVTVGRFEDLFVLFKKKLRMSFWGRRVCVCKLVINLYFSPA